MNGGKKLTFQVLIKTKRLRYQTFHARYETRGIAKSVIRVIPLRSFRPVLRIHLQALPAA